MIVFESRSVMERLGEWVIATYRRVQNGDEVVALERRIANGSCCIINSSRIASRLHLCVGIQRMVSSHSSRTKAKGTELLLMLAPTKNIAEALQTMGCGGSEVDMIVAVHQPSATDLQMILSTVKGESVSLVGVNPAANEELIMRTFNLSEQEVTSCGMEACVVNKIAICDI